jgi:hypothetical protein
MIRQAFWEKSMSHLQVFEWKSPNSPRLKKVRQVKSKVKSMFNIFFDIMGIAHKEFILTCHILHTTVMFMATMWKFVKTVPQPLTTKELALASWQCTISHFLFHNITWQLSPIYPTHLTWPLMTLLCIVPFWHNRCDQCNVAGGAENDFQGAFIKWQKHWEWCTCVEED